MYGIFSILTNLIFWIAAVAVVLWLTRGRFARKLGREVRRWEAAGIITPEQSEQVLGLYGKPGKKRGAGYLVKLTFFMAGVLLCVGVILFYSANWRAMPANAKLVQVFLLLFGSYAAAWYFLYVRPGAVLAGRVFLLLGMTSFGAGIFLIAQIFHISAHPTNGVLVWFFGVFATALVTGEPMGFALSAIAAAVWDGWEVFVFENSNPVFGLFAATLLYVFARKRRPLAAVAAFFMLVFWFYQVNLVDVEGPRFLTEQRLFLLCFAHLPLGCLCLLASRRIWDSPGLSGVSRSCRLYGWACMFAPFIGLSWPFALHASYPAYVSGNLFYTAELGALLLALLAVLALLRPRNVLAVCCGLFSLAPFLLPLGDKTVLVTVMHVGLVFFLFCALYWAAVSGNRWDRAAAFSCALLSLLAKGAGFFALGMEKSQSFYAAYLLGFMIFGTVVFLVNLSAAALARKAGKDYTGGALTFAWAAIGLLALYALSFRLPAQMSVFSADRVVLVLLGVFLALALLLYAILFSTVSDKLPLVLSGLVFLLCTGLLVFSGPGVPWKAYSFSINGLLFVCLAVLLYYGVYQGHRAAGNLALGGFLLVVTTRYFDLFWDLLSGSALFIVTGGFALLFGFALEKTRRRIVAAGAAQAGKEEP
ncbi:MAG: DUF2157 domain-containing protein [Thermodesulfobacteriota bacterium]